MVRRFVGGKLTCIQRTLEGIAKQVEELSAAVKSKRLRHKMAALLLGNEHAASLQKCFDDLDWAIKEFDVSQAVVSDLTN